MRYLIPTLLLTACFTTLKPPPKHPETVDPVTGEYPGPDGIIEVFVDGSPQADASPCGQVCAQLRNLQCREGFMSKAGVSCYRGCLEMASHTRLPVRCWTTSSTKEAARACGGLRCLDP